MESQTKLIDRLRSVQANGGIPCLWFDTDVEPLELDETGRWVTVRVLSTNALHTACIDELYGFERDSVPQVK